MPDLNREILKIGHWVVEGVVVDRYRFGRVFLGDDAAHHHPPTTGLGLNSAVQDAHNLAWKLATVLKGKAGDALLDTYESERRPVAERNVARKLPAKVPHSALPPYHADWENSPCIPASKPPRCMSRRSS